MLRGVFLFGGNGFNAENGAPGENEVPHARPVFLREIFTVDDQTFLQLRQRKEARGVEQKRSAKQSDDARYYWTWQSTALYGDRCVTWEVRASSLWFLLPTGEGNNGDALSYLGVTDLFKFGAAQRDAAQPTFTFTLFSVG